MDYPYPIYDGFEASRASADGDYPVADFAGFLSELLRSGMLEDPELGIVKFALSNGTSALSDKQHFHLKNVVGRFNATCDVCGETIPYSDRIALSDETNSCSYHYRG